MGCPLTAAVGGLWQRTGNYCLALRRLGVTPVVTLDTSLAASCDLLILPGGNDPDPSLFGEPWCGSRIVERALDLRLLALLTAFVRTRKPVLGICKGMQLINIWFGGSVIQDLSTRSLHQYSGQDQVHGSAAAAVGQLIMWATDLQPFLMGMFVSVLVGVALTLPISSAAICAALGLTGLAGGAAVAGCCAQMVGFAVISFRENRWGGLVAQGLGTSMLQVPNIIKNPRIWIAPTLASAITGPLATCVFHLEMNGAPVSSGMGTCGLVGQIGVIDGWVNDVANGLKAAVTPMDWVGLVLLCFVLPAMLSWVINLSLRKLGWVKDGDMKLDV